ncbi:hypothetical protein [Fimbriiglobus ruber]|uniref:Uncharacterized protein n=1 Tax=Fimbriiglobus ruber TaxID=1908690 RepID=A0A225DT97_9BACT|nr:hypothetical protein [Fimbriiglobus ruber]OWK41778.1 hypothetical protein FRUB_03856 [Fimbriiglobus ruber]
MTPSNVAAGEFARGDGTSVAILDRAGLADSIRWWGAISGPISDRGLALSKVRR